MIFKMLISFDGMVIWNQILHSLSSLKQGCIKWTHSAAKATEQLRIFDHFRNRSLKWNLKRDYTQKLEKNSCPSCKFTSLLVTNNLNKSAAVASFQKKKRIFQPLFAFPAQKPWLYIKILNINIFFSGKVKIFF